MAGKVGSASFSALYIDGYDLLTQKPKGFTWKASAIQEDTTGLGDTFHGVTPTGLTKVEVSQSGAFFDDSTNAVHALLTPIVITSNSQASPSVVTCPVPHGLTSGDSVIIAAVVGSNADINGTRTVTVITPLTFSVAVDASTAGGTGGYFTLASGVTKSQTSRILSAAYSGLTVGQPAFSASGVYGMSYDVLSQVGNLTKANVTYDVSGTFDRGPVLASGAHTIDWTGTAVNNGASSSAGAAGILQVAAFSGFTGFVGTIEDSPDNASWTTRITFANVTAAPKAQRVTMAGAVAQYVRFIGDVTGTGSITVLVTFSRG